MDLEKELQSALDRHLGKRSPQVLGEAIRYSLLGPGKRIRPRLTLSCAQMLGVKQDAFLPCALALEMIHCFTLIHDDLPCMDDDDYRRGRLSCHKRFDEPLALLAGDALIPLALQVFAEASPFVAPERFLRAQARLLDATGPNGVIGGQVAEMALAAPQPTPESTPKPTIEDLLQVHAAKTGALFLAALMIPAELAGLSEGDPRARAIAGFARTLGQAFQIADDLEDEPSSPGKAPGTAHALRYRSAAEWIQSSSAALDRECGEIRSLFGPSSEGLLKFAAEVKLKLSSAAAGKKRDSPPNEENPEEPE